MPFSRSAFSGFPFDRDDRDDNLRSQLDDIAKRHPEFAEHLDGFPFRTDSLGRRRPPRPSEEPSEFRRFAGRPFGSSRFERFGFPFDRDPFEEEHQRSEEPHNSQEAPRPKAEASESTENPKQQQRTPDRGRRQNIQQSNTVDLGQKQEPVNDRNQRSMSAPPPDNRSGQQRFVSSINIPINRNGGMGDMGGQQSQPQQEKPANKPTERVIPIHVEGRDEPVLPKHTGPSFNSQPQPERIFGQRPGQFTQYVGREAPRTYAAGPEWHHHPAYAKQKPAPAETAAKQPQEPPVTPPQTQPQPKLGPNPIDMIQSIQKDVSELMGQVENFAGIPRDKQYLYLDEMLTRNLIKLDNIDTQGQENIRQARKEAIKCIESCIGVLDAKAAANVPKKQPSHEEIKAEEEGKPEEAPALEEPAEQAKLDESRQQQPVLDEKMEVEVKSEEKVEEQKEETAEAPVEEKMELLIGPAVLVIEPELQENTEQAKRDVEMPEVLEENKTEPTEEVTTKEDSNKEKKKGKKKVVKK